MAFAKKTAQKAPANYAQRKAAEEVAEEVIDDVDEPQDEVQEVQDDYEEEAPAPAPRQAPAKRAFAPRQASPSQGAREPGKALRLTGLFEGKREGCFSGKLRAEDAANLASLIEEAQSTNQQIVFFLWENQDNPRFSLTANISAPVKKSWGGQGNKGGWNRGQNQNRGFRRY